MGYDHYLCIECRPIEKRNYEATLGHAYQSFVIREATCEVPSKTLDICQWCRDTKEPLGGSISSPPLLSPPPEPAPPPPARVHLIEEHHSSAGPQLCEQDYSAHQ